MGKKGRIQLPIHSGQSTSSKGTRKWTGKEKQHRISINDHVRTRTPAITTNHTRNTNHKPPPSMANKRLTRTIQPRQKQRSRQKPTLHLVKSGTNSGKQTRRPKKNRQKQRRRRRRPVLRSRWVSRPILSSHAFWTVQNPFSASVGCRLHPAPFFLSRVWQFV